MKFDVDQNIDFHLYEKHISKYGLYYKLIERTRWNYSEKAKHDKHNIRLTTADRSNAQHQNMKNFISVSHQNMEISQVLIF